MWCPLSHPKRRLRSCGIVGLDLTPRPLFRVLPVCVVFYTRAWFRNVVTRACFIAKAGQTHEYDTSRPRPSCISAPPLVCRNRRRRRRHTTSDHLIMASPPRLRYCVCCLRCRVSLLSRLSSLDPESLSIALYPEMQGYATPDIRLANSLSLSR